MKIREKVSAIEKAGYIALICEGGAEIAIMDILLDNDLLVFTRDQMINDHEVIPRTSVKEFQKKHLRVAYDDKLYILRVIDSRRENFELKDPYRNQIELIDVITAPEIEMLIIISEGQYREYEKVKSKKSPSDFCIEDIGIKTVKKQQFIKDYFADTRKLVDSIREYHRVHMQKNGELSLFDLLRP